MSLARLAKERKQILEGGVAPTGNSTAATLANPVISPAQLRIRADLDNLGEMSSSVSVNPSDAYRIEVSVNPKTGIWTGGRFCFTLVFTDEYPFEGPKIRYTGPYRVFHPNIEGDSGQDNWGVCLGLQTDWSPTYSIKDLVVGLEMLFSHPTYEDPLPGVAKEAAQLLKSDPNAFKSKTRKWMQGNYS